MVPLPFRCRGEYPLHFTAVCPRCRLKEVYHAVEVIQLDDDYCRDADRRVEERRMIVTGLLLCYVLDAPTRTLLELMSSLRRKLEERSVA